MMKTCAVAALYVVQSFAQSSSTVVGGGYGRIEPLAVAPGQILTLHATGVGQSLENPVVALAGENLPRELAGISVQLLQPGPILCPILELRPLSTCPDNLVLSQFFGRQCGKVLAITVQMPWELVENDPALSRPPLPAQLAIIENGNQGSVFDVNPVFYSTRLLRACDLEGARRENAPCGTPLFTHADGKLVTSSNPAEPGDVVIAYALGLGRTDPPATTGVPSPHPAVKAYPPPLHYRYGEVTRAYATLHDLRSLTGPLLPLEPDFVGLTPHAFGVYQISFRVPSAPDGIPSCHQGQTGPGAMVTIANLTVFLAGSVSTDSAGLCVKTPEPVP